VRDAPTLARIERLRIPPAWRDVHIAPGARAAIQAWGIDARGRRQYRYHERAVEIGTLRKFYRVRQLARDLPRIRRRLAAHWREPGVGRNKVLAGIIRLIEEGYFRVGNERYARENRSFGITTLRKSHVEVKGNCITFAYRGKSGVWQRQCLVDGALARFVARLAASPGRRLFRWRGTDGWHDVDARDVNQFLHDLMDLPYTAKDFRTWGGTLRLATVLDDLGPAEREREAKKNVVLAVRLVAAELGNTPAICRASYVHPIVIARYLDGGETIAVSRATRRPRHGHAPEERALIRFLDRHFPERRRRPRDDGEESAAA
jgi:DNA topoisomerase-1